MAEQFGHVLLGGSRSALTADQAASYTGRVLKGMVSAVRFWWRASAGHRLRPWQSPYLRWRVETYTGKAAETLRLRDFVALGLREWRQVGRFFRWCRELEEIAGHTTGV